MKKFTLLTLLIALLTLLLGLIGPWWFLAFGAFLSSFGLARSAWEALGASFIGAGGTWLLWSGWIHFSTGGLLSERIAGLIALPSPWLLLPITGLFGGLLGGIAGLSGYLLKDL